MEIYRPNRKNKKIELNRVGSVPNSNRFASILQKLAKIELTDAHPYSHLIFTDLVN